MLSSGYGYNNDRFIHRSAFI